MSKTDLAKRVEQKAEARSAGVQKTMDEWLEFYSSEFEAVLPGIIDKDRFLRLGLNTFRWQPELRDCDVFSVIGALMTCAQLGLDPSGPHDHVYFNPRNVNVAPKGQPDQWVKRVQLTIGYHGYIELAGRTGAVKHIHYEVVYSNEEFNMWLEDGEQRVYHKPIPFGDKGEPIGAYATARMVDGSVIVRAVDLDEIEKAKRASPSGSKNRGPWVDWWEAMAAKTAVRRLWKQLPKSPEAAVAYTVDTRVIDRVPELNLLEAPSGLVLDQVSSSDQVVEGEPDEEESGTEGGDVEEEDPTRPFESEEADDE